MKTWKQRLSEKTGLSQKECELFMKGFEDLIVEEFTDEDKAEVVIPTIGILKLNTLYNIKSRNPKTGEALIKAISKRVSFKPYPGLKEKI